jgi:excisionase family DNA binding protein
MSEFRLYTPTQLADILSVSVHTVYRWLKEGKLEAYKLGGNRKGRTRISADQVAKFLEGNFTEKGK